MLLRLLQWCAHTFLATVALAGLYIAISGMAWMYAPSEGVMMTLNRVLSIGGNTKPTHSELPPRIYVGALGLVNFGRSTGKPLIDAGAVEITNVPLLSLRRSMAFPEVRLELPESFVRPGASVRTSGSENLHPPRDGVHTPVGHVRPDHGSLDKGGALQPILHVVSQHMHPNLPLGATTGSGVVLKAFEIGQEAGAISDAQIARLQETYGPVARERLTQWRALMSNPRNHTAVDRYKLELVNDFMNRTPFKSDREHWGKDDYWAMPVEFLSSNGGDCEDFAIAKYFTLRALGVSEDKLQITYVKEIELYNQAHMVLAYFATPDAEPLILDNVNRFIQLASTRIDLVPVYSFNSTGLWLAKDQSGRSRGEGNSNRIVQWRELQMRMKNAA